MTDAQGLSEQEAAARLARDGPNQITQAGRRNALSIAVQVLQQPMFLLLVATAAVYGAVGDMADAAVLLVSVLIVGALTWTQEYRAERALAALRQLSSPRSRVVRGGRIVHIASRELVVGDRLLVGEGDRVACDAHLVRANGLLVDESLLTGESAPVMKAPLETSGVAPQPEHMIRAGTLVVQGDGVAIVGATGARTALGQIGGTLATLTPPTSRLQRELRGVVRRVAWFAVLASVLAAALFALRQGSWVAGLLAGLTLAMSIIPEEFAVVWTVMLALGAWRLARRHVLTRQAQAIETLGTTTVLAVDKTGTLTHNRMEVVALATPAATASIAADTPADDRFLTLLQTAVLASAEDGIEPMDQALIRLHERWYGARPFHDGLVRRRGVTPQQPYFSNLWCVPGSDQGMWAVKGAPEAVLELCRLAPDSAAQIVAHARQLGEQGLRVLGVARSDAVPRDVAAPEHTRLRWQGLLAFLDPLRNDVPAAIAQCRAAGIRVVMITGDAPPTAAAIARMAGLGDVATADVVTGAQLAATPDGELDALVGATTIYARVSPQQKLRIVQALQRRGEIVAMTGDGVNDASALRAADIGVAMGRRGTDVAREAAALVLLDDSFAALVNAVRTGRRIFNNLHNAVGYLIAVHVPIVGVSLLPVLTGGPALLLPIHVVLLELIIDPACSLVFEAQPEPARCMEQPPRSRDTRLLSGGAVRRALVIGAVAMGCVVMLTVAAMTAGWETPLVRLLALAALIGSNLLMLRAYLRDGTGLGSAQNQAFAWLLAGVSAVCAALLLASPWLPQLGFPADRGLGPVAVAIGVIGGWATVRAWRMRKAATTLAD